MFPLVGIPKTIAKFLKQYRNVFCKEAGFQHISRYINGLLMSPNKTLQGIYSQLVIHEEEKVSRRAMPDSLNVFKTDLAVYNASLLLPLLESVTKLSR